MAEKFAWLLQGKGLRPEKTKPRVMGWQAYRGFADEIEVIMNELILNGNNGPTMSSREIATLTGRRHDQVLRTARDLVAQGVTQSVETLYVHEQNGQRYPEHRLNKRDSLVLVARLSPEFTARIVDRWQELEAMHAPAIPKTLPEALRLAADMAEQNSRLTLENQQKAAEIEALQNLFVDGMTPTEFAKRLNGVNCQRINQELAIRNWLYKDAFGNWRVTSYARDRYLTERQSNILRNSGQVMVRSTPVLLKSGAMQIHRMYLARKLPMKTTWDGLFTHDKVLREVAA